MTVEVKGLREIKQAIVRTKDFFKKGDGKIMAAVGEAVIFYILKHTRAGQSYTGSSFKSYSRLYAKRLNIGRSPVTLERTGKMLRAIKKQVISGKEVRIYVANTAHGGKLTSFNLAIVHEFGANTGKARIPRRQFFGLTKQEIDKVFKLLDDRVSRKLQQIGYK